MNLLVKARNSPVRNAGSGSWLFLLMSLVRSNFVRDVILKQCRNNVEQIQLSDGKPSPQYFLDHEENRPVPHHSGNVLAKSGYLEVDFHNELLFPHALVIEPSQPNVNAFREHRLILFVHGAGINTETFTGLTDLIDLSKDYNCTFMVVDLCGYGLSIGDPTPENFSESLKGALSYLSETHGSRKIVLAGHSIGTGIVLQLFRDCEGQDVIDLIDSIYLYCPFTTLGDVCDNLIGSYFSGSSTLVHFCSSILGEYVAEMGLVSKENILKVPSDIPILIKAGKTDDIVSYELSEQLYHIRPQNTLFVQYDGGHSQLYHDSEAFFEDLLENSLKSQIDRLEIADVHEVVAEAMEDVGEVIAEAYEVIVEAMVE